MWKRLTVAVAWFVRGWRQRVPPPEFVFRDSHTGATALTFRTPHPTQVVVLDLKSGTAWRWVNGQVSGGMFAYTGWIADGGSVPASVLDWPR